MNLAQANRPFFRHLFVAGSSVVVDRLPAGNQQPERDVGVFGQNVVAPTSDGLHGRQSNTPHGAAILGHGAQVHARLLIDLVACRALHVEQACEQVFAHIARHHAAHDRTDFGVEERRHQLPDQR